MFCIVFMHNYAYILIFWLFSDIPVFLKLIPKGIMILSALIFRPGEDYTNIHQTPDTTQYQNIGRDGTDTVCDETYYD